MGWGPCQRKTNLVGIGCQDVIFYRWIEAARSKRRHKSNTNNLMEFWNIEYFGTPLEHTRMCDYTRSCVKNITNRKKNNGIFFERILFPSPWIYEKRGRIAWLDVWLLSSHNYYFFVSCMLERRVCREMYSSVLYLGRRLTLRSTSWVPRLLVNKSISQPVKYVSQSVSQSTIESFCWLVCQIVY